MIPMFLKRMFTVFFDWVSPDSRVANPRCMTKTRKVATIIQVLLTAKSASAAEGCLRGGRNGKGGEERDRRRERHEEPHGSPPGESVQRGRVHRSRSADRLRGGVWASGVPGDAQMPNLLLRRFLRDRLQVRGDTAGGSRSYILVG